MAKIAKKDKKTKEYIKTKNVTNPSTLFSQLEPLAPNKILLGYKISTYVSILSGTGVIVTMEQRFKKKGKGNYQQCRLQESIQFQINIFP